MKEPITLALVYDPETHQVTVGGDPMQLSLAQMICDEAARVLAEMRRMAAAQQVRAMAQENHKLQTILGGRHHG